MKFQPDKSDTLTITGYGPGWLAVDKQSYTHSLVVSSSGSLQPWDCTRFEDLGPAHFAQLAEADVETIIFGSGNRLRFPSPAWLAPLIAKRIGFETMDTPAACRTYNVLAGEGRKVLLAALVEAPAL
ncbi:MULTISPECIES: Mth938-like domain-containing protein [unclassified Comamonas]|uniref:Mth938-like domain-containing protein n=1 Tax=unclassified Comamonas TaxID=2638500 RepID=UPI00289B8ECC|nr:Mth938-like domain-containing protein [Comamonas sp.]